MNQEELYLELIEYDLFGIVSFSETLGLLYVEWNVIAKKYLNIFSMMVSNHDCL